MLQVRIGWNIFEALWQLCTTIGRLYMNHSDMLIFSSEIWKWCDITVRNPTQLCFNARAGFNIVSLYGRTKKASMIDTSVIHERLLSEADGTRTRNHRIDSPVL